MIVNAPEPENELDSQHSNNDAEDSQEEGDDSEDQWDPIHIPTDLSRQDAVQKVCLLRRLYPCAY